MGKSCCQGAPITYWMHWGPPQSERTRDKCEPHRMPRTPGRNQGEAFTLSLAMRCLVPDQGRILAHLSFIAALNDDKT